METQGVNAPATAPLLPRPAVTALYAPMRTGPWELSLTPMVFCPGYWGAGRMVTDLPVLKRGDEVWMSLAPLEVESAAIGIAAAQGHVAIFGLGMGWVAAECALTPQVTDVTVVERDADVIELHRALDLFGRLPDGCGTKVRIVQGDAMEWVPDRPVDLLMPDIWLPLVSEQDRTIEVRRMQANVGAAEVYFWGQELELARQCALIGCAIDDAGVARAAEAMGLPLAGLDTPDYPALVAAAAKTWMRGRWLPGSVGIPGVAIAG